MCGLRNMTKSSPNSPISYLIKNLGCARQTISILLLLSWCQIPHQVFRDGVLDGSELISQHKRDLHSIMQVILML